MILNPKPLCASAQPSTAPAETAKSVKSARRKTVIPSAQFLNDDKAIRLARAAVADGGVTVSKPLPLSPLSALTVTTLSDLKRALPSPPPFRLASYYGASTFTLSPAGLDAVRLEIEARNEIGRKKLKPLPFSRADKPTRARFCHDALVQRGPVHSIVVNLGDDVLAQAYAQPKFADWVVRRIKRDLNKALGRPVDLYLCLEELCEGKDGRPTTIRPHLTGEIGMSAAEAERARAVIRNAVGEWPEAARRWQVWTKPNPDFAASSYALKQAWKAKPRMKALMKRWGAGPRYVVSFSGNPFTATDAIQKQASVLYEQAVADVLAARRGDLLIPVPGPSEPGPTLPPSAPGAAPAPVRLAPPSIIAGPVQAPASGPAMLLRQTPASRTPSRSRDPP